MNELEKDKEIILMIEEFLAAGELTLSPDGTYKLSDRLHEIAENLINEKPELYPLIFPDRVN